MSKPAIYLSHKSDARQYWFGDVALDSLKSLGDVRINQRNEALAGDELVADAQQCDFIVLDRETCLHRPQLLALPNLVAIVRSGVDCSMVDLDAASELGIVVVPTPPGYTSSTAELGLGLLLSAARHIPRYARAYQEGQSIAPAMGTELASSTVGLVGYGRVGRYLGQLIMALGSRLLIADPCLQPGLTGDGAEAVELARLLDESDFVVLCAAVSNETRAMINDETIGTMKSTAWLINLARGELVDEDALEAALDAGRIAGVAMDVGSARDNLPPSRFARFETVIATPHIGNLTEASLHRQPAFTVANLRLLLTGEMPKTALNPRSSQRLDAYLKLKGG